MLATLVSLVASVGSTQRLVAQLNYQPTDTVSSSMSLTPEPLLEDGLEERSMHDTAASNPMLWQQYQALQAGGSVTVDGCQSCGGGGVSDYNRCGCNSGIFPWVDGPGSFDQWCVGPKWGVEANGLFFFREDVNFNAVTANLVGVEPTTVNDHIDQFEHGPGFRVFATAYNEAGYGLQVGYEGINNWTASGVYTQAPAAQAAPPITRTAIYDSNFNSAEVNFITDSPYTWKLFTGFRFIQLDEDFVNRPLRNQVANPLAVAVDDLLVDTGSAHLVQNHLFGFQIGSRRDGWNIGNRLTLESFASLGVYCNKFQRNELFNTTSTIIIADDPATTDTNEFSQTSSTTTQVARRREVNQIAFHGEAGFAGVWRINPCTSLRAGYQLFAVEGVGQGIDSFLTPNSGLISDSLLIHGLQLGFEYRR